MSLVKCRFLLGNSYTFKRFFTAVSESKIRNRIPLNLILSKHLSESLVKCNINYLYPSQYVIIKNINKYPRTIFHSKNGTGKTVAIAVSLLTLDLDKPAVVSVSDEDSAKELVRFLIRMLPTTKVHLVPTGNGQEGQNFSLADTANIIVGTVQALIGFMHKAKPPGIVVYDDIHIEIDRLKEKMSDPLANLRKVVYDRFSEKPNEIALTSVMDETVKSYLNEKLTGFYHYNLDDGTCELVAGNVNNDAVPLKAEFGYDFEIDTIFTKHGRVGDNLVCKVSSMGFGHRMHLLCHLLKVYSVNSKCLVYAKNRHQAKLVSNRIDGVCRLGRDLSKSVRNSMLEEFLKGNKNIFIATSTRYSKELSKVSRYIINMYPTSHSAYRDRTVNFKGKCITLYDKGEYPLLVDMMKGVKKTFKIYVAPTNSEIERISVEKLIRELVGNIKNVNSPIYTEVASSLVDKHGPLVLASLLNRLSPSL